MVLAYSALESFQHPLYAGFTLLYAYRKQGVRVHGRFHFRNDGPVNSLPHYSVGIVSSSPRSNMLAKVSSNSFFFAEYRSFSVGNLPMDSSLSGFGEETRGKPGVAWLAKAWKSIRPGSDPSFQGWQTTSSLNP